MSADDISIPAGWRLTKVGSVLSDIQPGFASGVHNSTGSGLPHFRPMNVTTSGRIDRTVIKSIDPELADRPQRRLRRGDVVFNNTNSLELVGKTAFFDDDDSPAFSNHMTRLRTHNDQVEPEYLARYLHACWLRGDFTQLANNHVSQASISRKVLSELPLPLPPIEEQRFIIKQLDQIDERRFATLEHLARTRSNLANFQQAAIADAFRDAESCIGVQELRLAEILSEPLKNGYSARPVNHVTPYRVLTLTATTSGVFNGAHFKYTDEEFDARSENWLSPGDIVVQRGNTSEYVGVAAIYEGPPGQFLYPDLMIRVRVGPEIDARFIWYMLLAPPSRSYLRERATGSAGNMPKINQKTLLSLPLPLPPLEWQQEIVKRTDQKLERGLKALVHMEAATTLANNAGRAAVAVAFRGDLRGAEE